MTFKLFGYPAYEFYKGAMLDSLGKAQRIQAFLNNIPEIKEEDWTIAERGTVYFVSPTPRYSFCTSLDEATHQHKTNPNVSQWRDYPLFETDVEVVGIVETPHYKKLYFRGALPGTDCNDYFGEGADSLCSISIKPYHNIDPESYLPTNTFRFSQAAANLILLIQGSDSGAMNGFQIEDLKPITDLLHQTTIAKSMAKNGVYATDEVERWTFATQQGTLTLYSYSVGYSEGYIFDVFSSEKQAKQAFKDYLRQREKADWIGTECLECGATFDEPGHVEPGLMSCDRCDG